MLLPGVPSGRIVWLESIPTMDHELARQLLQSLLRSKKAAEAFLAEHPHLSIEREADQLELLRLAKQKGDKPRAGRKPAAKAALEVRTVAQRKVVRQDWNKILHTAKTLALCSLPYDPVQERTLVRRTTLEDGTTVHVKFSAHDKNIELPYGKDRALITWLMTIARDQNNARVEFKSAMEFIRVFGVASNGKKYHDFRHAMERICNVTITYGYESETFNQDRDRGEKLVYDKSLPHKADYKAESLGLQTLPGIRDPYYIEFGQKTFQDLVANPVSVPLDIMKRYQNSPVSWDFLQFISSQIPELDAGEQKAFPLEMIIRFLGSVEQNPRKIRLKIDSILKDLGDYLGNVRLIGRGAASVLVIEGLPKELGCAPSRSDDLPPGFALTLDGEALESKP